MRLIDFSFEPLIEEPEQLALESFVRIHDVAVVVAAAKLQNLEWVVFVGQVPVK